MAAITLISTCGYEQYHILADQFVHYSKMGQRDEFKQRCQADLELQERYLSFFLEDEEMEKQFKMNEEDKLGMMYFREQSDVCSVLKYFANREY